MKPPQSLFKTNIIYGLILIVPLTMILLLLDKIVKILDVIVKPLDLQSATGIGFAMILAILLLIGLCFIIGSLLRTRIGALSFEKLEGTVLEKLPGYEIINSLLKGFVDDKAKYPSAMIRLYDSETAVFGFVVHENDNDQMTVFIPMAPMMTVGQVHVLNRDRVTILDATALQMTDCLSHFGIGSQKILNSKRA
jgi:uncharacterized membrane protein